MRVHWLQHVPFEGLGSIEAWLQAGDHEVSCTRMHEPLQKNNVLPDPDDIDLLIIMGGPMSIHDHGHYPWLIEEKAFIQRVMMTGATGRRRKVLGICLGAQLIADELLARVHGNPEKEIGWHDVHMRPLALSQVAFSGFPDNFAAFHWHGETFSLPDDAVLAASSSACEHQAFVYDQRIVGLQFHLETTRESAQLLIDHCEDELVDAPYVQQSRAMLSDDSRFDNINSLMGQLLDNLSSLDG